MDYVDFLSPVPLKGMVRIGNKHDGGYVAYSKLLVETDALMSYGVGWDTGFEEHFGRLTGKDVFMFDPTMFPSGVLFDFRYLAGLVARFKLKRSLSYLFKVIVWWQKQERFRKQRLYFINEGIAPVQKLHFDTLANHIERFGLADKNILLKIDVEGDEFAVFGDTSIHQALKYTNQIIIEWHDLKDRLSQLSMTLAHLAREFEIVHVHGNNWGAVFAVPASPHDRGKKIYLPDILEMTLVRRSQINSADLLKACIKYPLNGLDQPNNPRKPDLPLDFICLLF